MMCNWRKRIENLGKEAKECASRKAAKAQRTPRKPFDRINLFRRGFTRTDAEQDRNQINKNMAYSCFVCLVSFVVKRVSLLSVSSVCSVVKYPALLFVLPMLLFLASCTPAPEPSDESADAKIIVYASITPEAYIVERIGGAGVEVRTLVTPGQGPHTFSPTPKQMIGLAEAAAYFHVGGFVFEEQLAERIGTTYPSTQVVDVSVAVTKIGLNEHAHEEEEGDADHGHGELDPHIWLSPVALKTIGENIRDALVEIDPESGEAYAQNFETFIGESDALDARLKTLLEPHKGRTFYVYHPSFGYLAQSYDLIQEAVESDGKKPTPRKLQELVEEARRDNVRVIFVQPQFDERSAQAIAEAIGGRLEKIDPMRKDVLANIEEIAIKLERSFSGGH